MTDETTNPPKIKDIATTAGTGRVSAVTKAQKPTAVKKPVRKKAPVKRTPVRKKAPARKKAPLTETSNLVEVPSVEAVALEVSTDTANIPQDGLTILATIPSNSVEVRFATVGEGYAPLVPEPLDVGYDMRTPEDIWLPHGCRRSIDLGVIVECPEPLFILMVPRSSTGTKKAKGVRICNTVGVIDPRYRGTTDTIRVWLERSPPKKEYRGRLVLDTPTTHKSIMAQAYDAFGVLMDTTSTEFVKVSDEGYGVYDIFSSVEEPDLLYRKGDAFVQMLFIPVSRPDLLQVAQAQLGGDTRGGYGSTSR